MSNKSTFHVDKNEDRDVKLSEECVSRGADQLHFGQMNKFPYDAYLQMSQTTYPNMEVKVKGAGLQHNNTTADTRAPAKPNHSSYPMAQPHEKTFWKRHRNKSLVTEVQVTLDLVMDHLSQ